MLPYLITKNGRNIHLKDKYIPRDVKFGDKMSHSQKALLILCFWMESL